MYINADQRLKDLKHLNQYDDANALAEPEAKLEKNYAAIASHMVSASSLYMLIILRCVRRLYKKFSCRLGVYQDKR